MADREHLYEDNSKWLCLPGQEELCTTNLDATILRADGTMEVEPHMPAADPSFDCFYVYPTVSNDTGAVADWMAGPEEKDCVTAQAGRYSRVCRVFAPLYRQITLGAINGGAMPTADDRAQGYQDVIAAFNHYLTHYNQGRGFVLIGHSQGSGVLQRLIGAEIDGRPELRKLMVSAHLLGTAVAVPDGKDVGGAYKNIPVCRKDDQAGCVLAYQHPPRQRASADGQQSSARSPGRRHCVRDARRTRAHIASNPHMSWPTVLAVRGPAPSCLAACSSTLSCRASTRRFGCITCQRCRRRTSSPTSSERR
jgi:hypothetical protein